MGKDCLIIKGTADNRGLHVIRIRGRVTALVWSRFPDRTNREIRQILRNTARKSAGRDDWDPELGWGVLDAHRAVSLSEDQLCHSLETGTEEAAAKRDLLGDRGLVVGNI